MIELGTHENSPLRYPGSKSRRALRLLRLADQSRKHYIEPFGGGLSMLLRAHRERLFRTYHANDADADVMNFWTMLRDHSDGLIENLWAIYRRYGAGNEELLHKGRENMVWGNDLTQATAYFVLTRLCIKSDIRAGIRRTPKGYNGLSPATLERLTEFSLLLQEVRLTHEHYQHIDVPSDAFVFLDPPYDRTGFTLYRHQANLREFSEWTRALGASWMLTINDSHLADMLFADFDRVVEPVSYFPVGKASERQDINELIIMNYHRPSRDVFVRQFGWSVRSGRT